MSDINLSFLYHFFSPLSMYEELCVPGNEPPSPSRAQKLSLFIHYLSPEDGHPGITMLAENLYVPG